MQRLIDIDWPNPTLETNRRHPFPLGAGRQSGRTFYAPASVSGGGRSAWRWAMIRIKSNPRIRTIQI
jgi:hypothetical protein